MGLVAAFVIDGASVQGHFHEPYATPWPAKRTAGLWGSSTVTPRMHVSILRGLFTW